MAEPGRPAGGGGERGEGLGRSRGGFTSKIHLGADGRCREYLRRRGIRHIIPEKSDSWAARLRRGSRGGRPPGFDQERYKKRNTVERAINRLKSSRAVAARYDKRCYVFLGTVAVAVAVLLVWLRS